MADQQLSTPKVQSSELQRWHESNPIEELFYSQKEVARFLELGYLALRDHPDVAAEIRSTAQTSRTQHVLTAGLFKKFVVTATSVVKTYCPMMLDAVELQDTDIVKEAFGHVLEMCLVMKTETENSRDSYLNIQNTVHENLSAVNKKNKEIKSEIQIIEQEKKKEAAQLAEIKREEAKLQREQEELMKKVKTIETNRDVWLEKGAPSTGDQEVVHTVVDFAMIPTGAFIGGPIGLAVGAAAGAAGVAVGATIGAVALGLNVLRKKQKADQAINASHEANVHLKTVYEEKRKVADEAFERRQQTLEKMAHIEALDLKKFYEDNIVLGLHGNNAEHLHQDQKAGGVYLKKIEDEKYAEKFKLSIDKCEKTWNRIGIVCQNYVNVNDRVIFEVYGFMSRPIDNWTEDEVKQRKETLIKEITVEANQLDDVE